MTMMTFLRRLTGSPGPVQDLDPARHEPHEPVGPAVQVTARTERPGLHRGVEVP